MATTGAISDTALRGGSGASARKVGVLWGYPFTLVRRLLIAFLAIGAFGLFGLWILDRPDALPQAVWHVVAVSVAVVVSLYVSETLGVTVRPLPHLRIESVFAAIAVSCLVLGLGYLFLPKNSYAPPVELLCVTPALAGLAVFVQRKWTEARQVDEDVAAAIFAESRAAATRAAAELAGVSGVRLRLVLLHGEGEDVSPLAGIPVAPAREGVARLAGENVRMLVVGEVGAGALGTVVAPAAGAGLRVEGVHDLTAQVQGKVNLDSRHEVGLLARLTCQAYPSAIQRVADVVLGSILLLLTLPLWPLIALAIVLESGRPVFFVQERVGLWGKPFRMLKFRTMFQGAERGTGPTWAKEVDDRVTRVGSVLRRFRLDEFPQFLNVVLGQMSLVGPRPERPYFVERLSRIFPLYSARHCVRPGVTGWAQIRYPYGSSEADAREKLAYDLFYILNRSLTFYVTVLLETAKVVLFRRGGR